MTADVEDGLVKDVLAALADPAMTAARSEPVRSVLVRLARLDPAHPLSRSVLTTCGGDPDPENRWPAADPLQPFDDRRFVGHDGVLRLAVWLPDDARGRHHPGSAIRLAAEVGDRAHARLASVATATVDPESRVLAEQGLRSFALGDAASVLSSLAAIEQRAVELGAPVDDRAAQAALDELATFADPLELDGATRRALDRFRNAAAQVPAGAPRLLTGARRLAARNRTPVAAHPSEADGGSGSWFEPICLQRLPPMPRQIARASLLLLPPSLVLLARDPLTRSMGPVVEIEGVGQLSVLVFAVGMMLLGWCLGSLTRVFASHHSRLALLPVLGAALWAATHAQWTRRVISTVLVRPAGDAMDIAAGDRAHLSLWLLVASALWGAALLAPVLVLFFRSQPHRRRLARGAAVSVGTATALPGVAAVALLGVEGQQSAMLAAVGTSTVSAAITSQINATFMVLGYFLLPLACFEVFEALRGSVEGMGDVLRSHAGLQKPLVLLTAKLVFLVAGFTGLLPAALGGDRGIWDAPPERFLFATGAVLAAAAAGSLLRRAGPTAVASAKWWVLAAGLLSLSHLIIEGALHLAAVNFPSVVTPVASLGDPHHLSATVQTLLPVLLLLATAGWMLVAKRLGPALCLALAVVVDLPLVARQLGHWTYDLFGFEEFDVVLTVFVGIALLRGSRSAGSTSAHRTAATVLLAVSTVSLLGINLDIPLPPRGAYVGAVVVATAVALLRAGDINRHAARSPETATALVLALVLTAVLAALVLQSSVFFTGLSAGEPVLLTDWQRYVESAGRTIAPLFVAVWFMPGLLTLSRDGERHASV